MSEMDVRGEGIDGEEPEGRLPEPTGDLDIEAPEADAAEQRREVRGEDSGPPGDIPPDANPADAAEQRRAVELDEDDYR